MGKPPSGKVLCASCRQPLPQAASGRSRSYCSDACRMRAYRGRAKAMTFVPLAAIEAGVEVKQAPSDQQVQRAIMEARAVGFALQRLGAEARPELAWRCAKAGDAVIAALGEWFGDGVL